MPRSSSSRSAQRGRRATQDAHTAEADTQTQKYSCARHADSRSWAHLHLVCMALPGANDPVSVFAPGTIPARPSTLGRRCPSAPLQQPVAACRGQTGTATRTSFASTLNSSMPCMPWRAAAASLPTRAVSALTRCHGSFRKVKKRCRRADFAWNHAVKPQ